MTIILSAHASSIEKTPFVIFKLHICFLTLLLVLFTGLRVVVGAAGSLDNSFDGDGKVIRQFSQPTASGNFTANAVQNDGKILFAGNGMVWTPTGETDGFIIIRYNPNGTLDPTFGNGGVVQISIGKFENVGGMAIQPDGKILVSGTRYAGTTRTDFSVLRFNVDGTPDNSFDGNGLAVANILGISNEVWGTMVLQPDGKILVAGQTDNQTEYASMDWAIVRFNTDGSLDNDFDGDGKRTIDLGGNQEIISSLALQPSGQILCAGTASNGVDKDFTLTRLNENGSTDAGFGSDGIVKTQIGEANDTLNTIKTFSDGSILAAGSIISGSNPDIAIVKYSSDGQPDPAFGIGGIVTLPSPTTSEEIFGLQIQSDGRFYVSFRSGSSSAVAKFTRNGLLDPSFGSGGRVSTQILASTLGYPYALAIQPDGKLVVSGVAAWQTYPGPSYYYTLRYLDNSTHFDFDGDGKADVAAWRPGSGEWWVSRSGNGSYTGQAWGVETDKPIPADYDGDGRTDVAVWRPSTGEWWVSGSSDGAVTGRVWGVDTDVPVPADYDGDGKADIAVWRPSTGEWWVLRSSDGSYTGQVWGIATDKPIPADYDGDGKADIAVWRPSTGEWWVLRSSDGAYTGQVWGVETDKPVNGDFDGDGKTDIAVWRPSTGGWWILRSSDGTYTGQVWGVVTDIPIPADYDGDGKTDIAAFVPSTGDWWAVRSSDGTFLNQVWGVSSDIPIPSAFLR